VVRHKVERAFDDRQQAGVQFASELRMHQQLLDVSCHPHPGGTLQAVVYPPAPASPLPSNPHLCAPPQALPTVIGSNVTIGPGATIHAATIEDCVVVGMGAVVMDGAKVGRASCCPYFCMILGHDANPSWTHPLLLLQEPGLLLCCASFAAAATSGVCSVGQVVRTHAVSERGLPGL
jgi:hypothetical protein